jgi:hypothetical protein
LLSDDFSAFMIGATNDLVGDINKDLDLKSVEQALAR